MTVDPATERIAGGRRGRALRPDALGTRHAVAAGHPLAALAAFRVLEAGGNAVDAGIGGGICLGVVHSGGRPPARLLRRRLVRRVARLFAILVLTGCTVERPVPVPLSLPSRSLVPPPVISGFGEWHGAGGVPRPWQHTGIDIRVPIGTAVLAAAEGAVIVAGVRRTAGKMVVVAHADDLATAYMHLAEISVKAGKLVRRGEPIGRAGMTGNATTPHLHFAVCRQPGARCGVGMSGWDDPARHWVDGNLCYDERRPYEGPPRRFTFPLPCTPESA